ncbi:hypothetical protein M407DRAFT_242799 [Tulasnella calospora MUT 4182]|uniref:Uncharacterized protein n=1 Tax=Tulasnella calospora MUT 4182 TaxID=1051891 RepID=A0A0C3QNV0_9AGAM|nr:hypothetical protein M407DRAFT_242799 [Tulasnella calospora MUT 4182]
MDHKLPLQSTLLELVVAYERKRAADCFHWTRLKWGYESLRPLTGFCCLKSCSRSKCRGLSAVGRTVMEGFSFMTGSVIAPRRVSLV